MSLKDFQILSKIGEGSYSSVWRAKHLSDGQEFAIKKVKLPLLTDKEKENSMNEVRLLASIDSPYIVSFKEVFFEDNQLLCLVMEFASGGDFYNLILKHQKERTFFKEKDIWRFSTQMILGLKTLHDRKVMHRDLKCANIFLSDDGTTAKLGDLNVSKVVKDHLAYTQTGTPYYASPEVWRDEPYDAKSDIWSLGCVIYEIASLQPPFRGKDMPDLYKKVQKGVFDRLPGHFSPDLNGFISLCLQVNPSKRPSCAQLLQHPIIKKISQKLMDNMDDHNTSSNELLQTIRLPKNMKNLRALDLSLPKANYKKYTKSTTGSRANLSVMPINRGRQNEKYISLTNASHSSDTYQDSEHNSRRPREKDTRDSIEIDESRSRIMRLQKQDEDYIKDNRANEAYKGSIKRNIARAGSKLVLDSESRRVKDILGEASRHDRLARQNNHEARQEQQQPYVASRILERTKTLDEVGGKRLYLGKRNLMKDKDDSIYGPEISPKGQSGKVNLSVMASDPMKISHSYNYERGSIARIHVDRIDAMDRRAQQLINKYQRGVDAHKKAESSSKTSSPELRPQRHARGVLEKPKMNYEPLSVAHMEAYGHINNSPQIKLDQIYEIKKGYHRKYEERKGLDDSIEGSVRGSVGDRSLTKQQSQPIPMWWG